jgi:hypothetical protein
VSATAEQRALMDEDVAAVRAAFAAARPVVQSAADSWWSDDAAKAVLKQLQDQTVTLERWATTWRSWAERGTDDTGASYPISFWRQVGQDLADFAADAGKQSHYTLLSTVLGDTVSSAAAQLKDDLDPSKWSATTWTLLIGAGALVALFLVAQVAGSGARIVEALK